MADLGKMLEAISPNAAIIFAAWIFMGFLQQRYDSAIDRFREVVGDYRSNNHADERAGYLKGQSVTYRQRCGLMGRATIIGLVAAIALIASLMLAAIDAIVPGVQAITVAWTAASLIGFALVIVAARIVIAKARIVHRQLDDEMRDVPDFERAA